MNERVLLLAVCFLGFSGLLSLSGVVVLAFLGQAIPAALTAVVGTCLGALGGFLTQLPARPS